MKTKRNTGPARTQVRAFWASLLFALAATTTGQAQTGPDPGFAAQIDKPVYSMAVSPDGRILVGGEFSLLNGASRGAIGRLDRDGSLDPTFSASTAATGVYTSVLLTNGQILVGGSFTNLAGQARSRIGRLNFNGTLDATFAPAASAEVYSLLVQADGKILVAGAFTNLVGQARNYLGRLNANGSIDTLFNPNADGPVLTLAIQADGKILAGGAFHTVGGVTRDFLCRLNTDGSLDGSFVAGADKEVHALAVQANGQILVGGLFLYMNGDIHLGLARLNPNGANEPGFDAALRPGYLGDSDTVVAQSDGKFLVGGTAIGWFEYPYFARFNADGTRDTNFTATVPSGVHSIALQRDGRILHATYSTLDRLTNGLATGSMLRITESNTVIWLRGGTGPEVWRTTFESSLNGTTWTSLGAGTRVLGGWICSGVSVPTNAYLRARGFIAGGWHNASQSYVEAYDGPVVITRQPAGLTNFYSTTATFQVLADGTPALGYRWRKNGTTLAEGGNVAGTTTPNLVLSKITQADAASYSVVITNRFGAVTSVVAVLKVLDPWITNQPSNLFVDAGQTATISVGVTGSAPLSYLWRKNGTNLAGATTSSVSLTNVSTAEAGSTWQVIVTNAFGAATSVVAVLTVNGATVDSMNTAPNYPGHSLLVQPDGRIVLGGYFSFVGAHLQVGIARFDADGAFDTSFVGGITGNPDKNSRPVLALQEDGKILLAGGIDWANNVPRPEIARFNQDGTLDLGFNPGAIGEIWAMTVQPDGKIVVGGTFTNLAGVACNRLGRLNPDGTFDTNFVSGANGTVYSLALQPDGSVLVGGTFTALGSGVGSVTRTNLGRLNASGNVDGAFYPGPDGAVKALAVQADGSIVVGGAFTKIAGQARTNLARLGASGALDATFSPNPTGPVATLVIQTDGKIVVGGSFHQLGGQPRSNLGRLQANGTVDMAFRPEANAAVTSAALEPDGRLVVTGDFTTLNGQPRVYLGRLSSTSPATQALSYDSSNITWARAGGGPEVTRVLMDVWSNGVALFRMPAARIAGGWRVSAPGLPGTATMRARGWIAGSSEGSSWFAESALGPVTIERQPVGGNVDALTTVTLGMLATGGQPVSYQWFRNGAPVADGTNLVGALTPALRINQASGGEAGNYWCVVSNSFGSLTSVVATLTVRDPFFTGNPADQMTTPGGTAWFSAYAVGSAPVGYQWLKNGVPLVEGGNISGATSQVLVVSATFGADAAEYRAMATNLSGSATSAVARLTVIDPVLFSGPISQSVQRGDTVTFTTSVAGTPPFAYEWRHDGAPLPGATASSLVLTNVQWADAGLYEVVVTNAFGSASAGPGVLTVNLAPADSFNPGANGYVSGLAVQTDGKIVIGGAFTTVGGQPRGRLARLNADGTLDSAFNPYASNTVQAVGIQTNGSIVIAGTFTGVGGQVRGRVARINPDGTVDGSFNLSADQWAISLAIQPDGKIILGGYFTSIAGVPRNHLARLNADGTLDTDFDPGADGIVAGIGVQTDGRILVSGSFNQLAGQSCTNFGRLNSNGSLDAGFAATADGLVRTFAEQADGKILVGGDFATLCGQARNRLGRIHADGTLDAAFDVPVTQLQNIQYVSTIALQAEGRIVVGGYFDHLGGAPRNGLGRLNPDGTPDPTFTPVTGSVYTTAVQPDGNIVVAGFFASLSGQPRNNIGRLLNTDPATETLAFDSGSATWLRGGTASQLRGASFEFSTDAVNWILAGTGARIPGGWHATGLVIPPNTIIRARGYVAGGQWFQETVAGAAVFTSGPVSRTNSAGTTATFAAAAAGGLPLNYWWLKNGVGLADGGKVSGANTATLTLTNVFGPDGGAYQVVTSNRYGMSTSAVAVLTVLDPLITTQPTAQFVSGGQTATLSVGVVGSAPLFYQWQHDGQPVSGGTDSALVIPNAQGADAGAYFVVVTNVFGTATSAPALLTVNAAVVDAFNPSAASSVSQILVQPDGKILVAGPFGPQTNRKALARFHPDGLPDSSFIYTNLVPDVASTYSLALQTDARILGSGLSRQQTPTTMWRLNPNGTTDSTFSNQLSGTIASVVLQTNGFSWAGGTFSFSKPSVLTNLALVRPDGSVDTNFSAAVAGGINSLALQPDGQLLLAGNFTVINGRTVVRLARFTADRVLDTNFNPTANLTVNALQLQPDGKILVAGSFTQLNGQPVNRIGRLNPDGSLDAAFSPNANGSVITLALQADGKIVIGGSFTAIAGQTRNRAARLNGDGTLDPTFNPNVSGLVSSVALQADGAVLLAGSFNTVDGQPRSCVARVRPTGPATEALTFDGSALNWARGGTGPEVWRTTFEVSTSSTDWALLGEATRVAGGWRLTGATLPVGAFVRARGFITCGQNNAASWFVESGLGAPLIARQPASRTNLAGTTASFSVLVQGTAPLAYRWLSAGVPLVDGGNVSGAATSTLTLSNVLGSDAGLFSVVITNASGSVTSSVASLAVIEPIIVAQPASVFTIAGRAVLFSVSAMGTPPLHYQWRRNGTNLVAGGSALLMANPHKEDIGAYSVVASSVFGSVTSAVANLTLNIALPDSFSPAINDQVRSIGVQPDGKIWIGGNFNWVDNFRVQEFARLNADGAPDTSFPGKANSSVDGLAVEPDGTVLVASWSTMMNDWAHSPLGRFYPDGSLDPGVNPNLGSGAFLHVVVPQPDGKFIIGGSFGSVNGQSRGSVARFNRDGSLDSFNPAANSRVRAIALQPDGKVLLGGTFTTLGGQPRKYIGRVNADGTLDPNFNPGADAEVIGLVVQPDGRILVYGTFATLGGVSRNFLGRLSENGSLDPSFVPYFATLGNSAVSGLALQADGSVMIGGSFTAVSGQARSGMARLNSLGVPDATWNPQIQGGAVEGICIQPDGRVLIGGSFTNVNSQARTRMVRFSADVPAEHGLECGASTVTWWRSGVSPEVSGVRFEVSTDSTGTNWTDLGAASRIAGGWLASAPSLTVGAWVRARGFASGGRWNGSLSLMEDVVQVSAGTPPEIVREDSSFAHGTNLFGFTVRALPGQAVVIETTPSLKPTAWLPVQTNVVGAAREFLFLDGESAAHAQRFYRARIR